MEVAQELAAKRAEENSRQLRSTEPPFWQERAAWLLLCGVLVGVGLYILANYLRALAWALVLAIAIWPSYDRVRRQASPLVAKEVLPVLFTALVGPHHIWPFCLLRLALREFREVVDTVGRSKNLAWCRTSSFNYLMGQCADWWREHLSQDWAKEIVQQ
jgi:predicted PurR-regulated permease PerM